MTDGTWFTRGETAGEPDSGAGSHGSEQPAPHADQEGTPLLPERVTPGRAALVSQRDRGGAALVPQRPGEGERGVVPQEPGAVRPEGEDDGVTAMGAPELADWVRRHRTLLGGLALIAIQIWWKAQFVSHFFFWQDDYHYLDRALDNGITWKFLTYEGSGHLIPGPYMVAWALARVALYDWALASAVTLAILAAACLALLRLLRNLFGGRPAILIPLAVYLFTPLTMPDLALWSSAIESLPLQLATFMALDAHVRYVRGGRYGHALAAAAWMASGMLFFEKGMVLPLLLFAVTSAFFTDGRWPAAARHAAATYWKAWLLYGSVLAGYLAVFLSALRTSSAQPGSPGSYRNALGFMSSLVRQTFIPGAVGGPWQWFSHDAFAYSAPPTGLTWLSWLVAAGVIVGSIWNRRYAWRAWAILAGWVLIADMLPAIVGRIRVYGTLLGLETRYLADAAPVLAVCVALAFWPVLGRRDGRRLRRQSALSSQLAPTVSAALVGAFVFGSLWSAQAYENVTTSAPARNYIANARAALAAAPRGTVILDEPVPSPVMTAAIFGQYGYASKIIGEISRDEPLSRLRWVHRPYGTIEHLLAFGLDGRLRNVALLGAGSPWLPSGRKCWPTSRGGIVVPLPTVTTHGRTWTLRIGYFAWAAYPVTVGFGGQSQQLLLRPGLHYAYLPVAGRASGVAVTGLGQRQLCVANAAVGVPLPSNSGPAIPAFPVTG